MLERFLAMALLMSKITMSYGVNSDSGLGAIQFRISETEFSKVSRALLSNENTYITYRETAIEGEIGDVRYTLKNAQIGEGTPANVSVTIPKDDHVRATVEFEDMTISGKLQIANSNNETETVDLDVPLSWVRMVAEGKVETIHVYGDLSEVILSVPSCSVLSLTFGTGSLELGQTNLTYSDLEHIVKDAICTMFHLKFSLGFEESKVEMKLELFDLFIQTRAVGLQIVNSTVIVTQMIQPTTDSRGIPSYTDIDYVIAQFPPLRDNSQPFEMWFNDAIITDMWHVYKKERMIGEKPIPLQDLLPIFPYSNISTGSIPFFPPAIYYTFPNATADLIILDADVSLNVTNTTVQFNVNITGQLHVTLNCDRNRTYSAFDFNMFAFIPTEVGTDNKFVKPKYTGFGGNCTVLSSNIGHVASRQLSVLFYALPQILGPEEVFKDVKAGGFSINKLLPVGLYMQNVSVSIVKDHIVIGGRLSDSDPKIQKIPRDKIEWLGDISMVEYLTFPLYDQTPDDLEALPEQNCHVDPPHVSKAEGLKLTKFALYASTVCLFIFFLC